MASVSVATVRDRPAMAMAVLGLISGVLSAAFGFMFEPAWLEPIASLFFLEPGMMPIGVFYGIAIGLGMALCTGRQWAGPLLLVTTMIAWSAAIHTALPIFKIGEGGFDATRNLLAGVAAGAVGAGLTHLGAALVSASLRRPLNILLTTAVGALCGVLYVLGELNVVPARTLFVVWQPAVAFCIGLAMAGSPGLPVQAATSAPHRP